jgi:hypothetical protein
MRGKYANDETFDALVRKPGMVLMAFFARWDRVSRRSRPALNAALAAFNGNVRLVLVNIARCPGVCKRLKVMGAPEYWLYRDGECVARQLGSFPLMPRGSDTTAFTADAMIRWIGRWIPGGGQTHP